MTLPKTAYQRQDGDWYPTPRWITELICEEVPLRGLVWEPAAGDGAMVKVLREYGHTVFCGDIVGPDLGFPDNMREDFLKNHRDCQIMCSVVTNPPFMLAREFIVHALRLTELVGGMVVMVLRNEFDCAIKRRHLFARACFREKIVLTRRPIWFPDQQASNHPRHNFSIYVWDHQHTGPATIRWLPDPTDKRGSLSGLVRPENHHP
jgi:hypothetical protein